MNLLFDFTVDKAKKTIFITREFAADLDLVWDAFTKVEILEQWTAPKPLKLRTKEMDFREGGRWLYAMISQETENPTRYSLVDFIEIHPKTDFSTRNCFADENGIQTGSGFSLVKNSFKPGPETTTYYMEKKFNDLATLEMLATMGYKEGVAAGYSNLDEYLRTLVTSK
jgi:uncharacterized protein YndB with AHSA1/START domain